MEENTIPIDDERMPDLDIDESKQSKRKSSKVKPVIDAPVESIEVTPSVTEQPIQEPQAPAVVEPAKPEVRKKRVYNRKKAPKLNTKIIKRTNSIFLNYRF